MTVKLPARLVRRPMRVLCLVLAALILLGTTALDGTSAPKTAEQATRSLTELQDQYKKLEKELKANEKKLSQISKEKQEQKKTVNTISSQIDETNQQIDLLSTRIDLLNADISIINDQIAVITGQIRDLDDEIQATQLAVSKKQTDLREAYELLRLRVRAMYMSGNGSTLLILLTAEDFSTFMFRSKMLLRTAKHDNDLMAVIESDIAELEKLEISLSDSVEQARGKKAELDSKKTALDSTKKELQTSSDQLAAKQKEIQAQYNEAQRQLDSLDKKSAEYAELIRQQEKELDRANKEIEERVRQTGSKAGSGSGSGSSPTGSAKMIFPLKCSGVRITSPFGYRIHPTLGTPNYHKGTDFSAPNIYRQPIYAVRDGRVQILKSNNYWFGNYVVIDHGDGVSTLYAHCDSICIKRGAAVTQGQVIGYVGSTGQSTAPHLHFSVLVNSRYVDPMKGYLTLP